MQLKLLYRQKLYSGKIVDLVVDTVEIQGQQAVREIVRHPGGVVVLAELSGGKIPFVRQHRYPMDRVLLELPAGKVDRGEDPAVSAAREFEEETGYRAVTLRHVLSFYSSPGFCDELLHLYHTNQVEKTRQNLNRDEDLTLEFWGLEEAIEMGLRGEILDAKTLVALFWLYRHRAAPTGGSQA